MPGEWALEEKLQLDGLGSNRTLAADDSEVVDLKRKHQALDAAG
jgi:hypothetical protein